MKVVAITTKNEALVSFTIDEVNALANALKYHKDPIMDRLLIDIFNELQIISYSFDDDINKLF